MVSQHQFMKHPGYYSGQDSTCSNNIANHWAPALRLKRASASLGHYARLSLDVIRVTADGRRQTQTALFTARSLHSLEPTECAESFIFIVLGIGQSSRAAGGPMLTHWVHSVDPFGKKISWLFFFPNCPHHALSSMH